MEKCRAHYFINNIQQLDNATCATHIYLDIGPPCQFSNPFFYSMDSTHPSLGEKYPSIKISHPNATMFSRSRLFADIRSCCGNKFSLYCYQNGTTVRNQTGLGYMSPDISLYDKGPLHVLLKSIIHCRELLVFPITQLGYLTYKAFPVRVHHFYQEVQMPP